MALVGIRDMLRDAVKGGYAVPAFNILNHLTLKAVVNECEALRSPLVIQTSVATVRMYGVPGLAAMVKAEAERASVPAALHLDHCTDAALARQCVDGGWTSVMIDASREALAGNIAATGGVVEYAHAKGVDVEGELGAIGGVEDNISVEAGAAHLADVEQAAEFVAQTDVDAFAPAVGTAHGLYKGEPKLDFDRFALIRERSGETPLVVHGGTGLSREAFRRFIELGAAKINISTAIKQAYLKSAKAYLEQAAKPAPLELDNAVLDAVREAAREHVEIFGSADRV